MLLMSIADVAEPCVRRRGEGTFTQIRRYFGTPHHQYVGAPSPSAQAFLVEMMPTPGEQIRPHFHPTPQFQVVVGGSGRLGRHQVAPYAFHYADPMTVYGPIVPDPSGIAFLTLRRSETGTTHWMPESRHERRRGRNIVVAWPTPEAIGRGTQTTLIEPHGDGLVAVGLRLSGGELAVPAVGDAGGGQYRLVTGGRMVLDGRSVEEGSLAFLAADEATTPVVAAEGGVHVVVMQFPRLTSAATADWPRNRKGAMK